MAGPVFLTAGAAFLVLGLWAGWSGWPIAWLGASCALVGIAFFLRAPRLVGKREDGSFGPLSWALFGPFLVITWLAWCLRRLRSEPCWTEIAPGLYLGRRAGAGELPPGIDLVVDVTCELARSPGTREIGYRCLPVFDGCAPTAEPFRALVSEAAAHPEPVFIHCAAGHGRSATVAAGVLLARGIVADVAAAEALLRARRPGVRLTPAQRRLLQHLTAPGEAPRALG